MTTPPERWIEELKNEFIQEYKAGHKDGGMRSYLFTGQNGSLIADWWIKKINLIEQTHHQELQKVRREMLHKLYLCAIGKYEGDALENVKAQIAEYQSELDQLNK